jgi:hypothetical protein
MSHLRVLVLTMFLGASLAHADEEPLQPDDEIEQRLRFIHEKLRLESNSAHLWEGGWSLVEVGGAAYAAYQISQQHNHAQLAEGVIGLAKSTSGLVVISVLPLRATRAVGELDAHAHDMDPLQRLRLAEHLLQRNVDSVNERYTWRPHTVSLLVSLTGAIIIGALGDWKRGLESAGIGMATSELQIWSRPWRAKRDLLEYKQHFGPALKVSASGAGIVF